RACWCSAASDGGPAGRPRPGRRERAESGTGGAPEGIPTAHAAAERAALDRRDPDGDERHHRRKARARRLAGRRQTPAGASCPAPTGARWSALATSRGALRRPAADVRERRADRAEAVSGRLLEPAARGSPGRLLDEPLQRVQREGTGSPAADRL